MKYNLVIWPNDTLSQKCSDVTQEEFGSNELKDLVASMFDIMHKNHGIGLAAPQVGLLKNVFVVDVGQSYDIKPKVFINPAIITQSDNKSSLDEGCLSFPAISQSVQRNKDILVEAKDIDGKTFQEKASNLYAHVLQHEYDHLVGKTIYSYMGAVKKDIVKRKIQKLHQYFR